MRGRHTRTANNRTSKAVEAAIACGTVESIQRGGASRAWLFGILPSPPFEAKHLVKVLVSMLPPVSKQGLIFISNRLKHMIDTTYGVVAATLTFATGLQRSRLNLPNLVNVQVNISVIPVIIDDSILACPWH
jgi:hypothetical protein